MNEDESVYAVFHEVSSKTWFNTSLNEFLNELEAECREILDNSNLDENLTKESKDAFFCLRMIDSTREVLAQTEISDEVAYDLFTLGAAAEAAKVGRFIRAGKKVRGGIDKGNEIRKATAIAREEEIIRRFLTLEDSGVRSHNLVSEYRKKFGKVPSIRTLNRIKAKL